MKWEIIHSCLKQLTSEMAKKTRINHDQSIGWIRLSWFPGWICSPVVPQGDPSDPGQWQWVERWRARIWWLSQWIEPYELLSMGDLQDPKMEVPTIYKAYSLGLNFRGYPKNMAKHMVLTYLHVLDPGIPIDFMGIKLTTKSMDWGLAIQNGDELGRFKAFKLMKYQSTIIQSMDGRG